MKAYIILIWKEENKKYPRLIERKEFLRNIENMTKDFKILRQIRALSTDADTITVYANEKNLVFKYRENIDFNEEIKKIEISSDEKIHGFIKYYCQEAIAFKIIENAQVRETRKSKEQIISIMQAIKKAYPDNNEISTKLCEVLPYTYSILINKDRNESCPENPIIVCYTINEVPEVVITIKNCHKIIWAHLNEWCK